MTAVGTEQAIFFSAGNELIAMDRDSACRYWSCQGAAVMRSASVLLVNDLPDQEPVIFAGDFNGFVYVVDAKAGALLWKMPSPVSMPLI